MLDCLAVASLLLPRVRLKFVLELQLGCLVECLLWSAYRVFSDLNSRPFFPHLPVSLHCAFLARLPVRLVSVPSHTARSTSRLSRFRCVSRCSLDLPFVTFPFRRALTVDILCVLCLPSLCAPSLFSSGTVCSTIFSARWAVWFTDCLQCAVFWCLLHWVCFAWIWFVWSVYIIDNRVQWFFF